MNCQECARDTAAKVTALPSSRSRPRRTNFSGEVHDSFAHVGHLAKVVANQDPPWLARCPCPPGKHGHVTRHHHWRLCIPFEGSRTARRAPWTPGIQRRHRPTSAVIVGSLTQKPRLATNVVLPARTPVLGTSSLSLAPDLHRDFLRSAFVRSPPFSSCMYTAHCVACPQHRPYAAHCTAHPDLTHRPCQSSARLSCATSRKRLIEPLPLGTSRHHTVFTCRRRSALPQLSSSSTSYLQHLAITRKRLIELLPLGSD